MEQSRIINYPVIEGFDINREFYCIDIAAYKIPHVNVRFMFDKEYYNLFTQGYFHWSLPKDKKVGDIIHMKDSNQGIDVILRIFSTFPMTHYYPEYLNLGTVCMACTAAN